MYKPINVILNHARHIEHNVIKSIVTMKQRLFSLSFDTMRRLKKMIDNIKMNIIAMLAYRLH